MDDIVKHIRTKAKHKQHTEPQDDCPLCLPEEIELDDDEDDLFSLLDDEAEEAPAPDKKAARLNRIMSK